MVKKSSSGKLPLNFQLKLFHQIPKVLTVFPTLKWEKNALMQIALDSHFISLFLPPFVWILCVCDLSASNCFESLPLSK